MARLIDDVLAFSREARSEMSASDIDMTGLVQATLNGLAPAMTDRAIEVVAPLPRTRGDREMMQRVWLNLLDNAIKFTGHKEHALIEVGSYPEASLPSSPGPYPMAPLPSWPGLARPSTSLSVGHDDKPQPMGSSPEAGNTVYFVKDNGAGFDMSHVDKLFGVFQRLHGPEDFPAPVPVSPSSNGSSAGMADACGPKARWGRARRSISRCRRGCPRMSDAWGALSASERSDRAVHRFAAPAIAATVAPPASRMGDFCRGKLA